MAREVKRKRDGYKNKDGTYRRHWLCIQCTMCIWISDVVHTVIFHLCKLSCRHKNRFDTKFVFSSLFPLYLCPFFHDCIALHLFIFDLFQTVPLHLIEKPFQIGKSNIKMGEIHSAHLLNIFCITSKRLCTSLMALVINHVVLMLSSMGLIHRIPLYFFTYSFGEQKKKETNKFRNE